VFRGFNVDEFLPPPAPTPLFFHRDVSHAKARVFFSLVLASSSKLLLSVAVRTVASLSFLYIFLFNFFSFFAISFSLLVVSIATARNPRL
jgi:hypothetical protein